MIYSNDTELSAQVSKLKDEIEKRLKAYQKQHMMGLFPFRTLNNQFNGRLRRFPQPRPSVTDLVEEMMCESRIGLITCNRGRRFVVCPMLWKESLKNEDLGGFQWQPVIDARDRWLVGPELSLSPPSPSVMPQDMDALPDEPEPPQSFSELMSKLDDIRNNKD